MPTHCAECGELIPHNLTHDGLRYVIDQAIENPESQAIAEWLDTYFETGGPYFDRFDIAEAYACAAYDLNGSDWASKVQAQLARLRFRMSPMIDYQPYRLEGNSLAIYIETMRRQGAA